MSFAVQAKGLTIEKKKAFAAFYRKQVDLLRIHPNKPEVKVIFVDLDGDGLEEAIATSYEGFYETGWLWSLYRQVGEKWILIKGYHSETKAIQAGSGIYARPGEIFRLRDDENNIQFVVLNRNYDKLAPDGLGVLNKIVFRIDDKGVFQQHKVENLERLLAYRGARKTGIVKTLEVLTVEEFKGGESL